MLWIAGSADAQADARKSPEYLANKDIAWYEQTAKLENDQYQAVYGMLLQKYREADKIRVKYQPMMDSLAMELDAIPSGTVKQRRAASREIRKAYRPKTQPMRDELIASRDAYDAQIFKMLSEEQQERVTKEKANEKQITRNNAHLLREEENNSKE